MFKYLKYRSRATEKGPNTNPQPPPPPPQPQPLPLPLPQPPLPGVISFDLSKNKLNKGDGRNRISIGNVEVSYNYPNFGNERLTIFSIIIRTKDAMYIYKGNKTPGDRLFYIDDDVPENIPIYLNIKNLNEPIIVINKKQISNITVEENRVFNGRFHGGKKSRKRRSQKKKRKSQKSKKLRNENKSKKRRSQKKKQRKTHRKRK